MRCSALACISASRPELVLAAPMPANFTKDSVSALSELPIAVSEGYSRLHVLIALSPSFDTFPATEHALAVYGSLSLGNGKAVLTGGVLAASRYM